MKEKEKEKENIEKDKQYFSHPSCPSTDFWHCMYHVEL